MGFQVIDAKKGLPPLTLQVKLAYGVGELAAAIPASLAAFFMLYFFANVAGLSPGLAGLIFLLGRFWDGFNDPIIGWLSDRTHSTLGRRYPWMLLGVVPLAVASMLLWRVPAVGEGARFVYYLLVSCLLSLVMTAVQLPFTALAAELTDDYDERTSLMGAKSAFSLGGSILGIALAQLIFMTVEDLQRKYELLGVISGAIAVFAVGLCVLGTYQRYWFMQTQRGMLVSRPRPQQTSLLEQLRGIWVNPIFRRVLGLYLFAWVGIQVAAAMLPYFVDAWMGLPEIHFTRMALVVQTSAILAMFGWNWLGRRSDKRTLFLIGAPLAMLSLLLFVRVQPQQVGWMYVLGLTAGLGIATLYMVPFAMMPDVIDLDELTTGERREGLYFSAVVFLQKLGLAISLYLSGQILQWTGFTASAAAQSASALWAIRLLLGPVPALMILVSTLFAVGYPLTRERHQKVLASLHKRRLEGL